MQQNHPSKTKVFILQFLIYFSLQNNSFVDISAAREQFSVNTVINAIKSKTAPSKDLSVLKEKKFSTNLSANVSGRRETACRSTSALMATNLISISAFAWRNKAN